MRCLVLGGAGFLGAHLTNKLLSDKNNIVTVFDRDKVDYSNIKATFKNLNIVKGDFAENYDFEKLTADQEVVYHLVSTTVPSTSNIELIEEIRNNIMPTIKLLEACTYNHVKQIVFLSSGGTVYGEKKNVPLLEDDETTPICSYGIQKLAIEKYIQLFNHLKGLDYRIIRLSNPYGPYQNPNGKVGAVTTFLWRIMHDEKITIYGDGNIIRDYIYVDDAIDGILAIVNQKSKKVMNLGSGRGYSLNDIILEAERVTQKKAIIKYEKARDVDVLYNVLDISRYIESTRIVPQIGLSEGMSRLALYFREKWG